MTSTYSYQCKQEDWYAIKRVTMQLVSGFLCPPPSSNHAVNWIRKMKYVACCKWLFVLVCCPRFGSIWFHLPIWWHPTFRSLYDCLYIHGLRCFFVFHFYLEVFRVLVLFHNFMSCYITSEMHKILFWLPEEVKVKKCQRWEAERSFWRWLWSLEKFLSNLTSLNCFYIGLEKPFCSWSNFPFPARYCLVERPILQDDWPFRCFWMFVGQWVAIWMNYNYSPASFIISIWFFTPLFVEQQLPRASFLMFLSGRVVIRLQEEY